MFWSDMHHKTQVQINDKKTQLPKLYNWKAEISGSNN